MNGIVKPDLKRLKPPECERVSGFASSAFVSCDELSAIQARKCGRVTRLFRGCDLFDRRRLSVGLLGWFIRLGQKLIDHARTLLLLYSSLLRSLLFGPEFVIYFPAH